MFLPLDLRIACQYSGTWSADTNTVQLGLEGISHLLAFDNFVKQEDERKQSGESYVRDM